MTKIQRHEVTIYIPVSVPATGKVEGKRISWPQPVQEMQPQGLTLTLAANPNFLEKWSNNFDLTRISPMGKVEHEDFLGSASQLPETQANPKASTLTLPYYHLLSRDLIFAMWKISRN